ncbi:MAG TPA: MlaD family protein [Baekduia sp.]|nr:MlaD family protein [Baekduia sp.]
MRQVDAKRLTIELRRAVRPLALFLLLIACGLVAAGVIFKNQTFQKPWEDYYEVRADFDDAKGVVPGSQQVRISGVNVGVIKKIDLVKGRAVLTLSIQEKYGPLYRDARLRLRPSTPLQDLYVDIDRGTPAAGKLAASDVLPAERTETPVDIARVLNTFDADTRQRLGVLLAGLGKGLDDRGASLREAFARTVPFLDMAKRATSVVSERRQTTRRLVSNFSELTGVLARHDDRIASLVRNSETTLGELAAHDRPLAATIRELPATLSAMRAAFTSLRGAQDELDPALRSLDPAVSHLREGLSALERFGSDAEGALAGLRAPVRSLRPLARDLSPVAGSLRRTMAALAPQAPQFDRMTALFPPCLEQLSDFFSNTISFMKFEDEGGVIPRAEATFSADSLSPLLGTPPESSFKRMPTCTPGGQK